jgi:hypothetical protein
MYYCDTCNISDMDVEWTIYFRFNISKYTIQINRPRIHGARSLEQGSANEINTRQLSSYG